jgi:hypothetical protein
MHVRSCVLFRGEYEHLDNCPKCGLSRYKHKKDGGDNVGDGDEPKKIKGNRGAPRRVAWYFPAISRLKCMFATRKEAELLRWHKEGCKKNDGMMRQPAVAAQWGHINVQYSWFADDCRNIRFAMSTDDVNPFGNQSSNHNTWPVVLS